MYVPSSSFVTAEATSLCSFPLSSIVNFLLAVISLPFLYHLTMTLASEVSETNSACFPATALITPPVFSLFMKFASAETKYGYAGMVNNCRDIGEHEVFIYHKTKCTRSFLVLIARFQFRSQQTGSFYKPCTKLSYLQQAKDKHHTGDWAKSRSPRLQENIWNRKTKERIGICKLEEKQWRMFNYCFVTSWQTNQDGDIT